MINCQFCVFLFVIAQAVSAVPKSWKKPNEEILMVETLPKEKEVRESVHGGLTSVLRPVYTKDDNYKNNDKAIVLNIKE